MKNNISVVISAYNEQKNLNRCLSSVSWADEIIVVDNTSSDATVAIAKKYTKKVYTQPNHLMLNMNKNFGFEKATSQWILNLDGDEELTPELVAEIKEIGRLPLTKNPYGYWISRKNMIFGKWIQYGLWWPDKQLRLFRRGFGSFPEKHIHEYIKVDGEVRELAHPYIHHNYDTVAQYLTKLERCTTSEAIALKETQYQTSWYDAIRFPLSDFLKIFFAQAGYKDGLHGLVLALFQAFYSFVVFCKLWEMDTFRQVSIPLHDIEQELNKNTKEVSYWMTQSNIKESPSIMEKISLKVRQRLL